MALSGKLLADFSDFTTAVAKAEVSLKAFEAGGAKVATQLNKVSNSLSGTKLIQDAMVMAEAVERVGGAGMLTEKELAKVSAQALEATTKLEAMGKAVPERLQRLAAAAQQVTPSLQGMTATTSRTTNSIGSFSQGLSQADRTLAAFGVQIGPEIRALQELGAAAGKTASQFGLIGTAGLAAAAGLAGWKVGRLISDFFGLDEAIANATASLLGWGDAAAQAAGATTDLLARATQIAGMQITDFAAAQRIIIAENARMAASFNTSAERVKGWGIEIAAVRNSGNLQALRADLQNQNSTLQELSAQYHISVRALEYLQRTMKEGAAARKQWADDAREKYAKLTEAQDALNNAGDGWRRALAAMNADAVAAVQVYLSMGASQSALATHYGLTALQVKAVSKALAEQMAEIARVEASLVQSAANLTKQLIANGQTFNAEWQKEINQFSQMAALAKQLQQEMRPEAAPTAGETLEQRTQGFEKMRGIWSDAQINQSLNDLYESFYRSEGAKGNMPGTSYAPPALLSPGTSLAPTSTIINNTITMNGILATSDPSGKAALRSAVDDALMAGAKQGRKF